MYRQVVDRTVCIEAETEGRVLVVRASLADDWLVRLVVDTGAGTSALSLSCARRLGAAIQEGFRVRTPTGLTAVGRLRVPHLRVGPLEVRDQRLAVVPLPNDRVDGLLGLDFFRTLGAEAVTLRFEPPQVEVRLGEPT